MQLIYLYYLPYLCGSKPHSCGSLLAFMQLLQDMNGIEENAALCLIHAAFIFMLFALFVWL